MKSIRTLAITCGIIVIECLNGLADDRVVRLHKDGWWIRYASITKQEFNGQVQEYTCKSTYSLVGTVTEDAETCRWIELNTVCTFGEKEHAVISKYLVPEKDLLEHEQPIDKLKRGWVKANKMEVRAVKVGQGILPGNKTLGIFPGMWQNAERVKKEMVVDYQQGRLKIAEAMTLKVTIPASSVNRPFMGKTEDEKSVIEYTAWFDQTILPVYAAAKIQTKSYANDLFRLSYVVFQPTVRISDFHAVHLIDVIDSRCFRVFQFFTSHHRIQ